MPFRQITVNAGETKQLIPYNAQRTSLLLRLIRGERVWVSTERKELHTNGILLYTLDTLALNRIDGDEPELELNVLNPGTEQCIIAIYEGYGKAS